MLTRDSAIVRYDFDSRRIVPDRLTRTLHGHYLVYAERMLGVYRSGAGRARHELHRAVRAIFAREPDCPVRRIEAFCRILDEASQYEHDHRRAAGLRQRVFRMAAPLQPLMRRKEDLFGHSERAVKRRIADRLGRPWEEIDRELFADVPEFHRLARFIGFANPAALLAHYNVSQAQAALASAVSVGVWASAEYPAVLRTAHRARLMHMAGRTATGDYWLRLAGPASLHPPSRRYAVSLARFLTALVGFTDWRLRAEIRPRRGLMPWRYDLAAGDLTRAGAPAEPLDDSWETTLVERWGPRPRDGWRLERGGDLFEHGQSVFLPDFVFRHESGPTALLEMIGYWTTEYLETRLQALRTIDNPAILLAVAPSDARRLAHLPDAVIPLKSSIPIEAVLQRLRALVAPATSRPAPQPEFSVQAHDRA